METAELVGRIVRASPAPASDVRTWLATTRSAIRDESLSAIDRALLRAAHADRPAFAIAAGHQAALRQLCPALGWSEVVAFCASEERGAHPRHLRTELKPAAGGTFRLSGRKQWASLAPDSDLLLVIASTGVERDRNPLRTVMVSTDRDGVDVRAMPGSEHQSEIRHAVIIFDAVVVEPDELLPGDGYTRYLKPFRSIEDLHIAAALAATTLAHAVRLRWPEHEVEALIANLLAFRELGRGSVLAPVEHLALAGVVARQQELRQRQRELWQRADDATRRRFCPDREPPAVAARAKELRREAAWRRLRASVELASADDAEQLP